jgi:hypothetical protein
MLVDEVDRRPGHDAIVSPSNRENCEEMKSM